MKKLFTILVPLILVLSCEQPEEDFNTVEEILKGQDYTVYKGILTFRDRAAFTKLSEELKDKTPQQLNDWESSISFKSLRSLHEEAIQKEEVFLQEMVAKYPNNTTLTRKELGYTKFTTDFINKGLFVVNEFETIDMNVTSPSFGKLVNTDGVFRIGDELVLPQLSVAKFLKNGDPSKLHLLKNAIKSDSLRGIQVNEITRGSLKKAGGESGRTKAWTYCDDVNNGYRLIVYEEVYSGNYIPDETPCYGPEAAYWLRLRSLKKVLGTWQNHNTSLWYVNSTIKVEHWNHCNYPSTCDYPQTTITYYTTPVDWVNHRTDVPYGHTKDVNVITDYELGPCGSGGFATCPAKDPIFCNYNPDPIGELYYITRRHDVYGKGGTYCYVGE